MQKKKVCKKCHYIYEDDRCPVCQSESFATNPKGRVYVFDAQRSLVAKKMEINVKGEYAIKL